MATTRLAAEQGITHFDMAPMYGRGEAETVIGAAFKGMDTSGFRFTTKYRLGHVEPENTYDKTNHPGRYRPWVLSVLTSSFAFSID